MKKFPILASVLLTVSFTAAAQHHTTSTSSVPTGTDLGEISFPTSGPTEAQSHFIRGVLLLHSFEYGSARAAFAEASRIAPGFAMAYWGEAMTHDHRIWGEQDRSAGLAALSRLASTAAERRAKAKTDREKMYLDAVEKLYQDGAQEEVASAYSEAMGALARRFPNDLEAKSLHALSILGLTGVTRNTGNYMRAAAIAEEVYAANPKHPGALHYLIHAYDDPTHAPLGLRAARVYGSVAKGASHAQHMPSHIFFALGMWEDSIKANTDSMNTARSSGGGGYHPLHWLEHAYLQAGNEAEAAKLVAIVENDVRTNPSRGGRSHLAMVRATFLVEAKGEFPASMLDPVDTTGFASQLEFAGHDLAIGLAQIRKKDVAAAKVALASLRGRIEADSKRVGSNGSSRYDTVSRAQIEVGRVMEMVLDSAIDMAEGNSESAVRKAKAAAESEDRLVFEYGPPATVKPPWEAVGEIYLQLKKPKEATDAFRRALERYPNRRLSNEGIRAAEKLN
ncbi:MAG TPA: hypothetical protein VFZ49_07520 [Pyrinomonadaceae bacterium]